VTQIFTGHDLQAGTISDGDGPYIPGVDNCTWLIAPSGATKLAIAFSKFQVSQSLAEISKRRDFTHRKFRSMFQFLCTW
jgi:hypothetical protein